MLIEDPRPSALSAQQRAVLTLSATGLTSAGVAVALRIPADDVRACLGSSIAALGAGSRLEAVLIALRRGLIQLPPDGAACGDCPIGRPGSMVFASST